MSMRLVTVFGGTGFLGRRVVRHLREHAFSVRIASRHPDRAQRTGLKKAGLCRKAIVGERLQITTQPNSLGQDPFDLRRVGESVGFGKMSKPNLRLPPDTMGIRQQRQSVCPVKRASYGALVR
jgi:hypothetical protein